MIMSIDRIGKRIGQRDWEKLIDLWLEFLPQIKFPVESDPLPTSEISFLEEVKEKINQIEKQSTTKDHYFIVRGLHPRIFLEAVYLFYKSLNVLKSAHLVLICKNMM